jgi:hypothetical protein
VVCVGFASTTTRGELDCGAVTAGAWMDPDDTDCGELRTAGVVCVEGRCGGVVCDGVVTGSGRICGSGSGLGVICANAGEATPSAALTTTTAPSAATVRPSRSVDSRSVLTSWPPLLAGSVPTVGAAESPVNTESDREPPGIPTDSAGDPLVRCS